MNDHYYEVTLEVKYLETNILHLLSECHPPLLDNILSNSRAPYHNSM